MRWGPQKHVTVEGTGPGWQPLCYLILCDVRRCEHLERGLGGIAWKLSAPLEMRTAGWTDLLLFASAGGRSPEHTATFKGASTNGEE